MRVFLRACFINLVGLFTVASFVPGLAIDMEVKTFLTAAVAWTLLNKLVKPLIKLLLLPINLLTLGLFRWVINVLTLFLLQALVEGVAVTAFAFPGVQMQGFVAPEMEVVTWLAYIVVSISLTLTTGLVRWLVK